MARPYKIRRGDTLGKIARRFYGNARLYKKLALYNGIRNPNWIEVGQRIEIPSRRELEGKARRPSAKARGVGPSDVARLATPAGLNGIVATFGDIYRFIRDDGSLNPRWESRFLTRARLPFSIPLSWDKSKRVRRLYCHKKLRVIFPAVFKEIQKQGLRREIKTFGGCYNFRGKRTSAKLSTHSWGIAIDLNPETNAQGMAGNMNPEVVKIFRRHGFTWGGDWSGPSKDPMHFQFCTGY